MFQSHPVFDNESEIVRTGNSTCPVDLTYWQKRIDQVAGKTATGQSRMRIVWGQDWQKATMIVCGRRRLRYPFWRYEDAGEIQDIGIPRFYVEELVPRASLMADDRWANARFSTDPETGELLDVLGPCPEEGFYASAFCIAHHDEWCCDGAEIKNSEPCLGAYREPTERDIQRIQRALWNRDHASNEEVAPDESALKRQKAHIVEARDERRSRELRERLEDWTKTHAHTWTTLDPSVIKHGKYHWLSGHNKSGTPKQSEVINGHGSDSAANGAANA